MYSDEVLLCTYSNSFKFPVALLLQVFKLHQLGFTSQLVTLYGKGYSITGKGAKVCSTYMLT